MSNENKESRDKRYIKSLVKQYYQIQDHRIAFQNQIRALEEDGVKVSALSGYKDRTEALENDISKKISKVIEYFPIWTEFLEDVKGVGSTLAAALISEIDIEKAKYPSSLWKYCGYDVTDDGEGRSKKKKHLVTKIYEDSEGNEVEAKGITYNPNAKNIAWKIGKQMLMSRSPYKRIYNERKEYEKNRDEDISDGHAHARALRYMIKQFLKELHVRWRKLEGLEISEPWIVKQEGHSYDDSQDVYVDRFGELKNPEK